MSRSWSERLVNSAGIEKIHEAVLATEAKTSAEIVPMVVRSSSLTGHVAWILFLFFLVCYWAVAAQLRPQFSVLLMDACGLILSGLLAWLLSRATWVQRICTPKSDQLLGVQHRALLEFHLSRINTTENHTGVLIFVSILERQAVILADESIAQRFPEKTWQELIDHLLRETRQGDFAAGMCAAIENLGEILPSEFPPLGGRAPHELADRLVIKD